MKQTKKHIIYLILIILIGITPLIFVKNSEFGGADGKAEEVITEIAKQKPYYFVMRDSSMANDKIGRAHV